MTFKKEKSKKYTNYLRCRSTDEEAEKLEEIAQHYEVNKSDVLIC